MSRKRKKRFVGLRISVVTELFPLFEKANLTSIDPQEILKKLQKIILEENFFRPEGKRYSLVFGDFIIDP